MLHVLALASSLACSDVTRNAAERFEQAASIAYAQTVSLHGRRHGSRFDAIIAPETLWLSRSDRTLRQAWLTYRRSSFHQFWNGFVGQGAPQRGYVQSLAVSALNGSIAVRPPTEIRCRRHHRHHYAALLYDESHGAHVVVELDPATSLPRTIGVYDEAFTVGFSDIRYDSAHDVPFLTHAIIGSEVFEFDHASFGDTNVPHALIDHGTKIARPVELELIRNASAPNRRGIIATVAGHRLRMLLDSGSSLTILSPAAAARLKLTRPIGHIVTSSSLGIRKAPVAIIPDVAIGSIHLKNEAVAVLDHTAAYDGLIGVSLFSLGRVSLSAVSVTIGPSPKRDRSPSVLLDTYDGWPLAPASLGSRPLTFMFDTGTAVDALLPDRWRNAGPGEALQGDRCRIEGIRAWQPIQGKRYTSFSSGAKRGILSACVSSIDETLPGMHFGILGYPVVSRYVQAFDYRNRRMELKR